MSGSLGNSNNTGQAKHKRRNHIQPEGSGEEADSESDAGLKTLKSNNRVLHSTLVEESYHQTIPDNILRSKSVPETPEINKITARYNSQSAIPDHPQKSQVAFNFQTLKQHQKCLTTTQHE